MSASAIRTVVLQSALPVAMLLASPSGSQELFGASHIGSNGLSTLQSLDSATGVATGIAGMGFERCSGMVFGPNDVLFASCERADGSNTHVLVSVDPASGAATEIGATGCGDTMPDLAYRRSTGDLFAVCYPGGGMQDFLFVSIDPATGSQTVIGPVGPWPLGNNGGNALSFDAGGTLYWVTSNEIYTIDTSTGAASFAATAAYGFARGRTKALDLDPVTGRLFGVVRNPSVNPSIEVLAALDPSSGAVSTIGQTTDGMDAIAWRPLRSQTTAIPTLAPIGILLLAVLLGAGALSLLPHRA